jgi:Tfp pilus assembly protein PilN
VKSANDYINLLPHEEKPFGRINAWSLTAALFAVAWLTVFGVKFAQRRELKADLVALDGRKQEVKRQLTGLQKELGLELQSGMSPGKASLIRSLLGERVPWSQVFRQFSRTVPRGMWFDSLEGRAGENPEVRIRGAALAYGVLDEFMRALGASQYFEQPELSFAQKTVVQGREAVSFELVCRIRKAGEARK